MKLVPGSAMITWHTLNDVFEAFYNQSHLKCEIQLACMILYQGSQESNIQSMHQYSYSRVLSAMFNFSVHQSLAEENCSIILQTRRNV